MAGTMSIQLSSASPECSIMQEFHRYLMNAQMNLSESESCWETQKL